MIKVNISKEIFEHQEIDYAINKYSNIAEIDVVETQKYFECTFNKCRFDGMTTLKEFENYLIDYKNCEQK